VSSHGAALLDLRLAAGEQPEQELTIVTSEWPTAVDWFAGSTLAPWVNRLADATWVNGERKFTAFINDPSNACANHGLVFAKNFDVTAHSDRSVSLTTNLRDVDAYDFDVDIKVTYALTDAGLRVTYDLTNLDGAPSGSPAPFAVGSHPYLVTEPGSVFEFDAATEMAVDDRMLPTGKAAPRKQPEPAGTTQAGKTQEHRSILVSQPDHYTDACFTGLPLNEADQAIARLSRPSHNAVVRLWQDSEFTHLQVFTLMHPEIAGGQTLLALEPQTAAANALNTGDALIWLKPEQTWQASWGLAIEEMRNDER
jgi:aldose 1-epimerase